MSDTSRGSSILSCLGITGQILRHPVDHFAERRSRGDKHSSKNTDNGDSRVSYTSSKDGYSGDMPPKILEAPPIRVRDQSANPDPAQGQADPASAGSVKRDMQSSDADSRVPEGGAPSNEGEQSSTRGAQHSGNTPENTYRFRLKDDLFGGGEPLVKRPGQGYGRDASVSIVGGAHHGGSTSANSYPGPPLDHSPFAGATPRPSGSGLSGFGGDHSGGGGCSSSGGGGGGGFGGCGGASFSGDGGCDSGW
ncbi:hypothetical protein I302_104152 [Kwoniella bestiolae CBS 10118]|uniref:Uncharacterized protein n=1 Tax=Kwoniella bestiolae CBS 10118 TaxID=1296100 RepID=A0A1B9GAG2_9TREE|nr:hypothetical protein I302_02859 [Kwoniella bestiolae CBS 10118]OCF28008.1 hypothetical protein I302_02859 [Kwoniella bestiolae CBS 10118]